MNRALRKITTNISLVILMSVGGLLVPRLAQADILNSLTILSHNYYRCLHGVPALSWDVDIAKNAQKFADTCPKGHSGGPYGENIWWGYNRELDASIPYQAVNKWYAEYANYSYSNPGFSMTTGHFTQVVWKDSTALGCGFKDCNGTVVVVCQYNPPGNFNGVDNYKANVLPKTKTDAQCPQLPVVAPGSGTTSQPDTEGPTVTEVPDDVAAQQACKKYSDSAVAQQLINTSMKCPAKAPDTYVGPRWNDQFDYHYNWCITNYTPASDTLSTQRDGRNNLLNQCANYPHLAYYGCPAYAFKAVMDNEENLWRGCGQTGGRWHSDYQVHFNWCAQIKNQDPSSALPDQEQQARKATLAQCSN